MAEKRDQQPEPGGTVVMANFQVALGGDRSRPASVALPADISEGEVNALIVDLVLATRQLRAQQAAAASSARARLILPD